MQKTMYQVDAFAEELFQGNPAAVFYLEEFFPEQLMQALAAENNLAETAFVVNRGDYFDLRWFTPTHEAPFCGHATLAAAHTLIAEYGLSGPLEFHTVKVGKLKVTAKNDGYYQLDLPRLEPQPCNLDLSDILGVQPKHVFRNFENVFAVLESSQQVRTFSPNMNLIGSVDAGGVVITAAGDEPYEADFVSRYFAPQGGIPEDPVTGSTHASLVPYWAGIFDKTEMIAEQCSARGGRLRCTLSDERVFLGGKAVTYMKATVRLPSLFDM